MSDLLAIVGSTQSDEELLDAIARGHPHRVTLLVEGPGAELAVGADGRAIDSRSRMLRDRVAHLRAAIERRTGAVVVGLVASREQLRGWRFDRIVGGPIRVSSGPSPLTV